jgi:uncharacterized membrane protein
MTAAPGFAHKGKNHDLSGTQVTAPLPGPADARAVADSGPKNDGSDLSAAPVEASTRGQQRPATENRGIGAGSSGLIAADHPTPVKITVSLSLKKSFEHLHNKLVHVPIGFALAMVVLWVCFSNRPWLFDANRVLAVIGGGGALFALATGLFQQEHFLADAPQLHDVLVVHRFAGFSVALVFIGQAIVWSRDVPSFKKLRGWVTLGASFAVIVAGLFGGWLATDA